MVKKLYISNQNEPFELSRSKVDLFLKCPRCFYLDRSEAYRIARPSDPMSKLPDAVDRVLKNEFDGYRAKQESHPYMKDHKIDAVPFQHESILAEWWSSRHLIIWTVINIIKKKIFIVLSFYSG